MTLWYSVSIALIYFLFSGCVFLTFRQSCIAESRMRLDNELRLVMSAAERAPGRLASIEADFPDSNFRVMADQRPLYASAGWVNARIPASPPVDSDGYAFVESSTGRHYAIRKTILHVDGGVVLRVDVAQDGQQTFENLNKLMLVLLFGLPGILLVSLIGGYFLAGRVLSPMDEITRKASQITADDLSQRLPVGGQQDEFSRLARVFNETFERLEDAFKRMKQFTADASHELRTPLAVIRSLGENALQSHTDADCHADVIGSILEEVGRLTRLLDGLLILTRAESAQLPLNFNVVSLDEIALDVVSCLNVLAEEKRQTLVFHGQAELNVLLDETTFKQALINLIANAVQYTQDGGAITVRVRRCSTQGAVVEVDDNGPGIAAEHRGNIFERFYRVDKGRSQATGGSGLGLAIARWAIGLNGGTVEFEAKHDGGSIFRIALPAANLPKASFGSLANAAI
jgi:heavy metal sensor kinase